MTIEIIKLLAHMALPNGRRPRRNVLPNSARRAAGLDRYGRPVGAYPMSRFFESSTDDVTSDDVKDRLSENGYDTVQGIWRVSRGNRDCFVATARAEGRTYRVFADPATGLPFSRTCLQDF